MLKIQTAIEILPIKQYIILFLSGMFAPPHLAHDRLDEPLSFKKANRLTP